MLIPASGVMLLAMLVAPRYGICREGTDAPICQDN